MQLSDILSLERTENDVQAKSKKRALEIVSEIAQKTLDQFETKTIFEKIMSRERLGTTSIGCGIAIPHCRLEGVNEATAVLIKLKQGVDYDAIDDEPVDIIMALFVPEASTDEHLELLAKLADLFSQAEIRDALRQASSKQQLFDLINEYGQ